MKFVYYDMPNNQDIYLVDQPEIKVRATFIDGGDVFIYASDDLRCATYINQVIDPLKKPHIYFESNLKAIEDDEQFEYYSKIIMDSTNYQAQHKNEFVDGTRDGVWVPTYVEEVVKGEKNEKPKLII